jgi:AGCS family alanine or glycine:cation symporter
MRRLLLVTALALWALAGCDKPPTPRYPVRGGAQPIGPAPSLTKPLASLDLFALPASEAATVVAGDAVASLAYDGKRFAVALRGLAAPTAACPVIAYVGQGAGAARWEHRFTVEQVDGKATPVGKVFINGGAFGGKAPRTYSGGGDLSFYVPTLPGDYTLHVEADGPGPGCDLTPALPTVAGELRAGGGLTLGAPSGPTAVGVRAPDKDGAVGVDQARYRAADPLVIVGAGLAGVTSVRFGDAEVTPTRVSPHQLLLSAGGQGDTDVVVLRAPGGDSLPVRLPVEGTVHQIGDAMGTLASNIWGTWLVVLLVAAGLILTIVNGFPQLRGFRHALAVIRGHYDDPSEEGEITHFQALTAALSATVGLGNIAGVAVAVTNGGPGAVFWMWVCGFLGMATKYSECTLSTAYREVRADGTVAGGPMYYIKSNFKMLAPVAFLYAGLVTVASFGGGNMFQSNQAAAIWHQSFGVPTWVTGLLLVGLVGLVIIGGIKRIGRVTDKLVPAMCGVYVVGALAVIFTHLDAVPGIFGSIFTEAFQVSAAVGGVLGVVIKEVIKTGFQRAAFSNEAGFGSAAIAHAAVKTDEPIREGVVALLEPFIDTIVICTMTALVILISGAWTQQGLDGVNLTAVSFDSVFEGFGSIMVPVAVFLFAISTMISWSYYGEKGVEFLFGRGAVLPYRFVFIGLIFIGAVWKLGPVLDFSDAMLGLLIVPNVLSLLLLSPKLRSMTKDYFGRLRSGEMVRYK